MTQASSTAPNAAHRYHFLLRRLHSLAGLVPIGVFLCFHLFTNFQMLVGNFQHEVDFIHNMPALFFVELGLWLSLGFHAALGFYYTFVGAKMNVSRYPYMDNWRYTLQRITGIIAFVFILVHVAHFRWRIEMFGVLMPFYAKGPGDVPLAAATTAASLQHIGATFFYLVGVLSAVYHFANGLWTMAITWGLTVTVGAQRRWGKVCLTVGILLAVFSIGALVGAWRHEIAPAEKAAIQQMQSGAALPEGHGGIPNDE